MYKYISVLTIYCEICMQLKNLIIYDKYWTLNIKIFQRKENSLLFSMRVCYLQIIQWLAEMVYNYLLVCTCSITQSL